MKWFDNFINKRIRKILRIDSEGDYAYYQPDGIFLMFDNEHGLLISTVNDGSSIHLAATTLNDVNKDYGIENTEANLNELKSTDELTKFTGQTIKEIKVGSYNSEEVTGDNFIIKQGKYAGIILLTENNKFTFYNDSGGYLWIDENLEFPRKGRWTII